jgi:hypothetical protein
MSGHEYERDKQREKEKKKVPSLEMSRLGFLLQDAPSPEPISFT